MAIFDLFSKRKLREEGNAPDVYKYNTIPQKLRVQVTYIWMDTIGHAYEDNAYGSPLTNYNAIIDALKREYGVYTLKEYSKNAQEELFDWFVAEKEPERCLDAIELSFKLLAYLAKANGRIQEFDEAVKELNHRFREHGIGYQFEDRAIIRIDSQLVHAEVVKPALRFLAAKEFSGANQEYLDAHKEYRTGNHRQCIHECGKALESTLKAICDKRKWPYDAHKDTASKLIEIVKNNGLFPTHLESQLSHLIGLMKNSAPVLRNKSGGHGQGSSPKPAPEHLAAYQLHQTAAVILMLCEAEKAIK